MIAPTAMVATVVGSMSAAPLMNPGPTRDRVDPAAARSAGRVRRYLAATARTLRTLPLDRTPARDTRCDEFANDQALPRRRTGTDK